MSTYKLSVCIRMLVDQQAQLLMQVNTPGADLTIAKVLILSHLGMIRSCLSVSGHLHVGGCDILGGLHQTEKTQLPESAI